MKPQQQDEQTRESVLLSPGEKVRVMQRRRFEKDVRRHVVGDSAGVEPGRSNPEPVKRNMKLTLKHHDLRSTNELDSLIEERILALQPRLQIDEANVSLEHRRESSPAFRIHVHLVTPGPDVFAEGRDHTIRAAMAKVMAALEDRIGDRIEKRHRRARGNLQESTRMRMGQNRR